jgi:hypothetical protein
MHDVKDIRRAWDRNGPPLYITMAAYVGWKPEEQKTEDQRFDDLMRMLGNGGG